MLSNMLFHFMAFAYMHHSQSYGASNTKEWDLEKWMGASLNLSKTKSHKTQS